MSYIGVEPTVGTYILLDDISSSFNGVLTEFDAETGGESVTIQNVNQILCAINGVVQEPTDSVQIGSSATKISFTTAPQAGDSFWCVILGDALPVGQASVTTAKLAADAVTGAKIADSAVDTEHLAASAVETAKINNAAVTNAKIADDAVTLQKIQNNAVTVAKIAADALKAIGAVTPAANRIAMFSGTGDATPTLLDFLDEDDMSSDSATAIASQQSIKAFLGSVAIIQYKGTSVETIGTSWTTRVLNTETDPQSFVSLSANQITIPAGTYYIKARAPVQIDNANTSYRSFKNL